MPYLVQLSGSWSYQLVESNTELCERQNPVCKVFCMPTFETKAVRSTNTYTLSGYFMKYTCWLLVVTNI